MATPKQNATLTAANSVFVITVEGLFRDQTLRGFSADNVFDTGELTITEVSMGIDGKLSGGFVFNAVTQNVVLQADSASNGLFELWAGRQRSDKDVYIASAIINLPALGVSYNMTRGFLTSYPPTPNVAKILQQRSYAIMWESVTSV